MFHPNTTKWKSPLGYSLPKPVEGVEDMVDFRSTCAGIAKLRRVGIPPNHASLPNICIGVWRDVQIGIIKLPIVTDFIIITCSIARFYT